MLAVLPSSLCLLYCSLPGSTSSYACRIPRAVLSLMIDTIRYDDDAGETLFVIPVTHCVPVPQLSAVLTTSVAVLCDENRQRGAENSVKRCQLSAVAYRNNG